MDTPNTNKKKKILVTGASGFLGEKLCNSLLNHGYSVRAFVRHSSDLSSLPSPSSSPHFELAFGDITHFSSLLSAVSECHTILHSAALVEPWLPDPSRFFTVNVGGLKNVIQAYKESNTVRKSCIRRRFSLLDLPMAASRLMKIRFCLKNFLLKVHHEKFFCTEYERSKVAADKIALQAASEGVPIVALYPGVIYGPGKLTAGNIVAKMLIERFSWRLPGYIGNGSDKYSFSYVDDVVEGHIAAMEKGCVGERYLLTGDNASFKYVFDAAAILTNTSKPRLTLPLWLIEAYGWISVLFARITGKLPLISPPTVYVLRHQWAYSCGKAKKDLGYNPRNLKEGLEEVLLWLKNSGFINY
ncbi:putative dihydroflavonol 4-reductase [Bienertia sinuspersici]